MVQIDDIIFEGSFPRLEGSPSSTLPEVALIGRSNVGKSSLLNMMLGRKNLARVSRTPGKTAHLNFFQINHSWRLVDLPGYGYAVASKKKLKSWDHMVRDYLLHSKAMVCTLLLIDGNIPPQNIDFEFLRWLGENERPVAIVFTKSDKSKPRIYNKNRKAFENKFLKEWHRLPPVLQTSAEKKQGRDELLSFIFEIIS